MAFQTCFDLEGNIVPCEGEGGDGGSGGGGGTTIGAETDIIIAHMTCSDRQRLGLVLRASATGAFRLDLLVTPDRGTTWVITQQVASAAVTVDGGTSGFTQNAEMITDLPFEFRIVAYNPDAVDPIDVVWDIRFIEM